MALTSEKLKAQQELPEVEKVETDHSNLHLTRDEFEAKYRKKRELKARLAIAKEQIEKELEDELEDKPKNKGGRPKKNIEEPEEV